MISREKEEVLAFFAEGRRHYTAKNFEKALACFEDALKRDAEDGPSKVYVERCRDLMENPPPQDWDGVYVMKTK